MDSAVTRPHPGHLSWQIVVSDAERDICINTTSVSVAPIYGCLPSMFYASSVQPGRATPNEAPFLRRCTIVGIDSISRPRQRVEHAYLQDRANPDVIGVAADLTRRLGRFDQAIEFAQYLLQLDPLDVSRVRGFGVCVSLCGQIG